MITACVMLCSVALPTFAQYGGSSSSIGNTPLLTKDRCPDGDLSGSFYDDTCERDAAIEWGSIVDGFIFYDDNRNGSFDSTEDPIQGAVVELLESDTEASIGTDITNSRGYYEFVNVQPGSYIISVQLPVSFAQTLFASLFGSVNAQESYRFGVVVEQDGSLIKQDVAVERGDTTNWVSSVDGGNMADDAPTEEVAEEPMPEMTETPKKSILDMMNGNSFDAEVAAPATTTTTNDFMLPTALPATGANPA